MTPIKAWSFSRWDLHHQCPLKFKLRVIDKLEEPAGEAMLRGRRVHNAIRDYLVAPDDVAPPLPPAEAGKQAELVKELRQFDNKVVEKQWGFTVNWTSTGWFADDAWYRSVLDVGVLYDDATVEVVDWKTGKPRGTYAEEMELFAVSAMIMVPSATSVETRLAFTDVKAEVFATFPRTDLYGLMRKWNEKVRPMFEDTTYLPRPNEGCKFCAFSRSNGGQCRYG